jgi:hypothetical protein
MILGMRLLETNLVNENLPREKLEGLCTYVLHLQPADVASVASKSDGLGLGLRLCDTETPGVHQRIGHQNLEALSTVAVHPYIKGQASCDKCQGKELVDGWPLLERRCEVLRRSQPCQAAATRQQRGCASRVVPIRSCRITTERLAVPYIASWEMRGVELRF